MLFQSSDSDTQVFEKHIIEDLLNYKCGGWTGSRVKMDQDAVK